MDKIIRKCLLFGVFSFLIGLILSLISFFMGATQLLDLDFPRMYRFSRNPAWAQETEAEVAQMEQIVRPDRPYRWTYKDNEVVLQEDLKDSYFYEEYAYDIRSIDIEAGISPIYLRSGDTFSIEVQNDYPGIPNVEVESRVSNRGHWKIDANGANQSVIITIPDDTSLDTLDIQVSTGEFVMDDIGLTVRELNVDNSVGHIELSGVTAERLSVENSAGTVNLYEIIAGGSDFDAGTGVVEVYGNLTGEIFVESGSGNMSFYLTGAESDYSHSVDVGMGHVSYGDISYNSTAKYRMKERKSNHISIDCKVGSVSISFDESL